MTFIIKQAERTAVAGYLFGKTACQYVTTVDKHFESSSTDIKTCHHRHSLSRNKVFAGCRRLFSKKPHLPLGERKILLAGCIFDGLACQKCFCVTLDKSNRTEDEQVYEIGGVYNAKNDKCNGG